MLWLTLITVASFGQSKKWTPEQIKAVDKIITSMSNKEEDKIMATKRVALILNISEQEAKNYIVHRSYEIVLAPAAAISTMENIIINELKERRCIYTERCVNHINKLHKGELLTYDEVEDFSILSSIEAKIDSYGVSLRTIYLNRSKMPIMRDKQIIYGDGSGKFNYTYWDAVVTLRGTIEIENGASITQLVSFMNDTPCIILWCKDKEDYCKTHSTYVYEIENGEIKEYRLAENGHHDSWASADLKGFTNDVINKWQQDSIYIVENLQTIVNDAVDIINNYDRPYYNRPPKFDLSSAMSKKAKPLPDNYKNILNNLRYIETQGDYEVWTVGSRNDLKEVESLISALQSEKNLEAYFDSHWKDDEYTKSIIRRTYLPKFYYMLPDFYKEQLPRALLNNQYYVGALYIKYNEGRIGYPLFLINRTNSQVFLVEGYSMWNNKPKIKKIMTQSE